MTDPFTEPQLLKYTDASHLFSIHPLKLVRRQAAQWLRSMNIFSFIRHWLEAKQREGFWKVGSRVSQLWPSQIWRTGGPCRLIRSAAVQCHVRPMDPLSVECVGLYAKASNILLLLRLQQLMPARPTGTPKAVPNGMYERLCLTLVTPTTRITPSLCIELQNVISQVESSVH